MSMDEFYSLRDTEDYFNFFHIDYDQSLVNVKRFHMMKEYGNLIKKGIVSIKDESKLLEFLRFSLLQVYGEYKSGHAPSAAEVWNMYENKQGCFNCGIADGKQGGSCATC